MTSQDTQWVIAGQIARDLHRGLDRLAQFTTDPDDLAAIDRLKNWGRNASDIIRTPE